MARRPGGVAGGAVRGLGQVFSARDDVARRAHCLQRAAGPAGAEVSRRERGHGDAGDEDNRGDDDDPPTDAAHHHASSRVRPGVARTTSRTAW
jgi:hypothetical protein